MLILERGEKVPLPPAVWFQAHGDAMHDYKDVESNFPGNEPQRFAAAYEKAGGEIALEYFKGGAHPGSSPDLSQTGDMFERMVAFVRERLRASLVARGMSHSDAAWADEALDGRILTIGFARRFAHIHVDIPGDEQPV